MHRIGLFVSRGGTVKPGLDDSQADNNGRRIIALYRSFFCSVGYDCTLYVSEKLRIHECDL